MAITLKAHVAANSTSGSFTTAAIDTTGATLLVASAAYFNNTTRVAQITDSKNNTWVPLPIRAVGDTNNRTHYCVNPTVGSGHTFTLTDSSSGSFCVAAFDGVIAVSPLDLNTGNAASGSTIAPGSLTPTNANSLVISGLAFRTTGTVTVDSGFTISDQTTSGSVVSSALGYIIETTIVAKNPTWTLPSSMNAAVTNAVFIAGTTTAPTTPAVISSVNLEANGTATSSAIDTTGATILVINQSAFGTAGLGTLSDSRSNTWTPLTQRTISNTTQRLYYASNPTTGTAHTFTVAGITSGSIQVAAISGVATASPFDVEAGGTGTADAAVGSVTPSAGNACLISGLAYTNSGPEVLGVDSNYKIIKIDPASGAPASVIGGALAFLALPVSAPTNPKWYFSQATINFAAENAVFKQSLATTNQTTTGKARIQTTASQTLAGKARIQLVTSQTTTGKSRIGSNVTKTLTGLARLTVTTLQTVSGKARLTKTVLQTITGKARIALLTNQTITGKATLLASSLQTLPGKARVLGTVTKTITGKANLRLLTNQLLTGKARLAIVTLQTIFGKARIFKQTPTDPTRIFEPLAEARNFRVVPPILEFDVLAEARTYKVVK